MYTDCTDRFPFGSYQAIRSRLALFTIISRCSLQRKNDSSNVAMSFREAHGQKRFGSMSHFRSRFSRISFLPLWTRTTINTLEPQIIHVRVLTLTKMIQTAHVHSYRSGTSGPSFLSFVTIDPQESLQDYCKFRGVGCSWWAGDVQF